MRSLIFNFVFMKKRIFLLSLSLFFMADNLFAHGEHPAAKTNLAIDISLSDFSNLHPLVVHFPIALLLLAVLAQLLEEANPSNAFATPIFYSL